MMIHQYICSTFNYVLIKFDIFIIKQKDYLSNGLYKLADGPITECKRVKISKVTVGGKTIYNVITSIGSHRFAKFIGAIFSK